MRVVKHNSPTNSTRVGHNVVRIAIRFGLLYLCAAMLSMSFIHAVSAQNKKQKSNSSKKETPAVATRRVLVFSPDAKGGVSEQIADDITSVEVSRLDATHLYEPVNFLASIPTIKLALNEQTLSQSDVKHPFDNDTKLKKLSDASGYDLVLVSSVDDYEFDPVKNQVNLVISARLIDYSGAKAVVRSAGASGSSPANPTGNQSEYKMAATVARSVTDKLMNDILNPKPPTKPADTGAGK